MTDYSRQLKQIEAARSLEDLRTVVNTFPAKAQGRNGILYSGWVGEVHSEVIAKELSRKTGIPIINDTARAEFLAAKSVERSIHESAQQIFMGLGQNLAQAKQSAEYFLYGNGRAPAEGPLSVQNSLWGQASREFAASVDGDIIVVASTANVERVLAQVEIPTALQSTRITTLGGRALTSLQDVYAQGGTTATLSEVQAQFIDASAKGIYILPNNFGATPGQVAISREFATTLHFDGSKFAGAQALSEAGFVRASLSPTLEPAALAPAADLLPRNYLSSKVVKGLGAGGAVVLAAYDAYTTAKQYQALSAQSNPFGSDALLRRYEGRTAGGVIGGIGAGAAYGFVAGAETGPGALVTGVVGSVVGAFGGDRLAVMITEHKVNHQTGADGVTYLYEGGVWKHTHYQLDPDGSAVPNPCGAPSMQAVVTTAPAEQVAQLDYQRMTAITALALANPATQDTRLIELDGIRWHATRTGWAQSVELPDLPNNSFGIPAFTTVDRPADAQTARALDQLAANRKFNNTHYAEAVANAYVMDYYGKGWSETGPLPEVVTQALGLASEKRITDPQTGHVWNADGHGHFSREETRLIGRVVIHESHGASGEELARLGRLEQSAIGSNANYGRQLIAQKHEEWQTTQLHASTGHGAATGPDHHPAPPESEPTSPDLTSAPTRMAPPITPASSDRAMFDALVAAARTMDIDTMRSIGQQYLQSEQGQAWLAAGQQLNQQLAQQAEQEAQVRQAVAMQR